MKEIEAKLDLIAHIVARYAGSIDFVQPYYFSDGTNIGQCKYCKSVGCLIDHSIRYTHAPDCLMDLVERLRRGLLEEKGRDNQSEALEPSRHDGTLGEDAYVAIRDQFGDVRIQNGPGVTILDAIEALSLLDWLEQYRAELERLAKEKEDE